MADTTATQQTTDFSKALANGSVGDLSKALSSSSAQNTLPTPISTSSPAVTSGAPIVANAKPAVAEINNTIKPALTQAQIDLQTQQAKTAADKAVADKNATDARNTLNAGYYKDATGAVYENGSNRHIEPAEFKQKGLNIDLIKGGTVPDPSKEKTLAIVANNGYDPSLYNIPPGYRIGEDGMVFNSDGAPVAPASSYLKSVTNPATYTSAQNTIQNNIDSQYNEYKTKVDQIANGVFPLSASQQSQLDSVKQQFDILKQQQQQANAALVGGINTAEIASGRSDHFREISQGNIANAVNTGIAKIAELDSKAAQSISQLTQAFQSDDYKLIKDSWESYQTYQKSKSDELTKLYDAQVNFQKQQTDLVHQQLQDTLASDKLSNDSKQQAIDNAFKSAQITETQRHDMATELQAKVAAGQANGDVNSHLAVQMTGNGVPSKSQQASYLQSLGNPDLATLVKSIADYSINPASVPTRNYRGVGGLTQSQVLTLVKQYDPSFEQGQYAARQTLQTQFKSGKYSQNINALNTATGHLVDILGNTQGLGNIGFTPYNQAKNAVETLFGAGNVARASLNIAAATGELATVFKGTGASDQEIKNLGIIDTNSSPDQVKAYLETATQLLASRLNALDQTYQAGMGKSSDKTFLSPSSVDGLLKLQQQGLNIQVPELARAPQVLLQTFHDASSDNQKLMDGIVANHPDLKNNPQAMMDFLAQNGIDL